MRKDMKRKLVDTYREGGGYTRRPGKRGRCKNPEVIRDRRTPIELEEVTDEETGETYLDLAERSALPRSAGTRPKGGDRKDFGENLSPLWRYLQKQVGRNWDKVYSEICENMDRRSAVGGHIFEHLWGYVVPAKKVRIVNGVPSRLHPYDEGLEPITYRAKIRERECFYVDPRDNVLKHGVAPDESYWKKSARERKEDREDRLRDLGGGVWMTRHLHTDLWYRLVAVDQEYRYEEVRKVEPKYEKGRMQYVRDEYGQIVYEARTRIVKHKVHKEANLPSDIYVPEGKAIIECKSASKKDLKLVR